MDELKSNFNNAEFLNHFRLNTDPFSSDREDLKFFHSFNLNANQPLTAEQTIVYIQFILTAAGANHQIIIEEKTLQEVFRLSTGRIDQIRAIMDRALHNAFKDRTKIITKKYVKESFIVPKRCKNVFKFLTFNSVITKIIIIAVLFGLIGTAFIFWSGKEQKTQILKPEPIPPVTKKKSPPLAKPSPAGKPLPTLHNTDEKSIQSTDDKLIEFLSAYHLERYEPLFLTAIFSENFNDITDKIYNETGMMLIHFTSLPAIVEKKYHIYEKILLNPVHIRFFLFWKPTLMISKYENGIKGHKIKQLQTMLQKIDLYPHEINGIVDTKLTRSLIRFQRRNQLEKTGFPDITTLFFLTILSE
ncbi:peptidoglycan-binding domain-containing protein [Desulfobacter latus]|uniref:Peptidoglycan-binding protein n=1 Tax=Desulfobacter latus TaxID=2292 RepID=A0A850T7R3_9BACT|nr:peptidoglycan-binding domain-containing protein [Desulfobacter latus]NWH04267.1 peptidoglycan-binding protein [Desulfobacter latus]